MKFFTFLLVGIYAFVSVSALESDVIIYGDDDFSSVADHETVLVMFYAPWCGHCKKLKPEFYKAAEDLKINDPPVMLAQVDCTEAGKEICGKHGVSGYPTLKIFKNGEVKSEYGGPRDASGIVKYMKAQVGPVSKLLKSIEDVESFITKPDVAIVGFFKSDDSSLKSAYLKVAEKLKEEGRFGDASDGAVLKKYGYSDDIVIFRPKRLHNKFEDNLVKYSGSQDNNEIEKWVKKNYYGLVGVREPDNLRDFTDPIVIAYFAVDYKKNVKGTNYWRNRILKVATNHLESGYKFAISAKDNFQHELNDFGIDYVPGDKPIVVARDAAGKKYLMTAEFSVETFDKFMKDLLAGNLESFLKSEAVPEDNTGPVTVLVAKNFDELVTNSGKDALLEFYAPWCGHCKKLAPTYDELGIKLKDEENIVIGKMDATANDVPSDYDVKGFPTLFWRTKDGQISKYEGGREIDDFMNFIAKSATDELKGWDRKGNVRKEEL